MGIPLKNVLPAPHDMRTPRSASQPARRPLQAGDPNKKTRHAGNSIAYHVWVLGLVWVSNVYPVYDTIFLIYRSRNGYQQLIKHIDVMFFLGKYGWNHQLDTINSNSIGSGIGMGRMINPQI